MKPEALADNPLEQIPLNRTRDAPARNGHSEARMIAAVGSNQDSQEPITQADRLREDVAEFAGPEQSRGARKGRHTMPVDGQADRR